ncbi:s-adenosylmethionine-dependent methyltransferase family [Fusarium albosuccineum]|uniref:S-adenosylmethionine-dependent methyltransferase family n=1 Tax=Fusarium albosuccineum TaxID=1237068 RepID=A0A8H4KRJ0_9HYPO|nr:s-adenosylmethionine-dependent methyltransferase family [Fusarium albosuccineum]
METSSSQSGFALGFVGGIVFTLAVVAVVGLVVMRMSDIYGLGHWKLNVRSPPESMWMNVGYWKTPQGEPVEDFRDACRGLLKQVVGLAGLLDQDLIATGAPGSLAILDLGFGCGDQTWELARLAQSQGFRDFRYVGLTLNDAQVQTSRRKIYREVASAGADAGPVTAESFSLFCANAAKPETWTPQVSDAVYSLADERFTERWLLALDCLYHFSPSRKPVFEHAARELDANFMAFDLLINESASTADILKARAIGKMMGCPLRTFLSEKEYRDQLVECGYDRKLITVKEITDDVFSGLVRFMDRQDQLLGEYGVSLGGLKLAGRLFNWFDRSRVVRAVVVVARTKSKTG